MSEDNTTVETEAKERKSIVPSKYGNKYKKGGNDELAQFINSQCTVDNEFDFGRFFSLCRENGLPEEKVGHYEAQVNEKRHGSQGRARMTLRNMLATIVRKNGKLVGLDGDEHELTVPALPVRQKAEAETAEAA